MAGEIGHYVGIDFIGGGEGAVDKINGTVLKDKDCFLVGTPTQFAPYSLDADSGLGENSPQIIAPNLNPGDKRWILTGGVFANLTVYGAVTATGLSVGTGELTCGSINRAAGTLNIKVGGLAKLSIGATDATFATNLVIGDGKTIGQAAGPLMTFDDTNNFLEITGCKVGIGTSTPDTLLHLKGANGALRFEENTKGELLSLRCHSSGAFIFEQNYDTDAAGNIFIRSTMSGHTFVKNLVLCDQGGKVGVNDPAPGSQLDVDGDVNSTVSYKVDDTQVVSNRKAAVADATDNPTAILRLNELLARCRAHGLIAI